MTVRAPEKLQVILMHEAELKGMTRNALVLKILWDWTGENLNNKDYIETPELRKDLGQS